MGRRKDKKNKIWEDVFMKRSEAVALTWSPGMTILTRWISSGPRLGRLKKL